MTRELPTGVVTFLFTDVEGSTRMLRDLGPERYASTLERHNFLLRKSVETHAGHVVDNEGDGFLIAFASAADALRCSIDLQLALANEGWPGGTPVTVRMGIHSGEAQVATAGYISVALHEAARIAAAASGGQVLVSETTEAVARDSVPGGTKMVELGSYVLKDFLRPARLFALHHPKLPNALLAPRANPDVRHNLPAQSTPFSGRREELDAVVALITDPDVRLLTLAGPGGTGKTRLVLQAAAETAHAFAGGVWFVALAPVTDPRRAPAAVCEALGVRQAAALSPDEALRRDLAGRRTLLVLDNLEHLRGIEMWVGSLLEDLPDVKIVTTSRRTLNLGAERVYRVPPMKLPGHEATVELLAQNEAVELFVRRAQSIEPGFALTDDVAGAVATICRRVDGLPLGIELAAARVRYLAPADLLLRLEDGTKAVGTGPHDAPERHRTLEAAVAWSLDDLASDQRRLADSLSVFRGGWTLEAAAEVCGASFDDLVELADASLIRRVTGSAHTRFEMLEVIRDVCAARLDAQGAAAGVSERHAGWFMNSTNQARSHLRGLEGPSWMDRLAADHQNIAAAFDALSRTDPAAAAQMIWNLVELWRIRGPATEGLAWIDKLPAHVDATSPHWPRLVIASARLNTLPDSLIRISETPPMEVLAQAVEAARTAGDDEALAYGLFCLAPHAVKKGKADFLLGLSGGEKIRPGEVRRPAPGTKIMTLGTGAHARPMLDEALGLAVRINDDALASDIRTHPYYQRNFLGIVRSLLGAPSVMEPELAEARRRGDRLAEAEILARRQVGSVAGHAEAADEALAIAKEIGNNHIAVRALLTIAEGGMNRGRLERSAGCLREALALALESGNADDVRNVLESTYLLALTAGDRASRDAVTEELRARGFSKPPIPATGFMPWWPPSARAVVSALAGFAWPLAVLSQAPAWLAAAGFFVVRAVLAHTVGPAAKLRGIVGLPLSAGALVGFAAGVWWQTTLPGALATFTLLAMAAGLKSRKPLAKAVVPMALVALAAEVSGLFWGEARWFSAGLAVAGCVAATRREGEDAKGAAASVGSSVGRLMAVVLAVDLFASWRTAGAFDLGPWGEVALWATPAAFVLLGLGLSVRSRPYAVGGMVLACSAPFQPWAATTQSWLAVTAGGVFGLSWVILAVAVMRDRPFEAVKPVYRSRKV